MFKMISGVHHVEWIILRGNEIFSINANLMRFSYFVRDSIKVNIFLILKQKIFYFFVFHNFCFALVSCFCCFFSDEINYASNDSFLLTFSSIAVLNLSFYWNEVQLLWLHSIISSLCAQFFHSNAFVRNLLSSNAKIFSFHVFIWKKKSEQKIEWAKNWNWMRKWILINDFSLELHNFNA